MKDSGVHFKAQEKKGTQHPFILEKETLQASLEFFLLGVQK